MYLPQSAIRSIQMLEQAGFAAYAVGGCVRDSLMGLTPQDFDLCTAALPEKTREVFRAFPLVLAGEKHGTVAVVTEDGPIEITTFRREGDYLDNRHPEWVEFVPDIQDDLARRDYTINAMAWSPTRGFADPFGGREDLQNRILRAVGDPSVRFREDSLRILRGARFAAKYHLSLEENTKKAMFSLAYLMDNLARERVFDELCKLLLVSDVNDLLTFAPILAAAIPEIGPTIGFDQRSPHHAYDLFTHIAHVTAATPPELPMRLAGLLHDIGKVACFTTDETGRGHFYGHAQVGAEMADAILRRLKAPTALREHVVTLIDQHMTLLEPDRKILKRRISRLGLGVVRELLTFQEADMSSKGTSVEEELKKFTQVHQLLDEIEEENACLTLRDLAVSGDDLIAVGFPPGKDLGQCLASLLDAVVEEKLPNTREALLSVARKWNYDQKYKENLPHSF